ncbi:DC-STAMP domain-containing protein 2 [Xenopus tropicalis]|uniref:DC-STAMP domain-containing protein 2 n=1 Tax=Xenopus tropicalis TaxID=8364 RepID=A0A8J0T588_XENTR|nr:DC-STAMP domain-containing protein 2 [Xenopus tropicalis]
MDLESNNKFNIVGRKKNTQKNMNYRRRKDSIFKEALRSFFSFVLGMVFATAFAFFTLFVKTYSLDICIISSVFIGFFLSLGMAFFEQVRLTVFLTLPQIFGDHGRNLIIALAISLTFQGPVGNILENYERVSEATSCGLQLAINQTLEVVEEMKQPVMRALDRIKSIADNFKTVSDNSEGFFTTLKEGVKKIGRGIRTAWSYLYNMGTVCNEELGNPSKKCYQKFDEAKQTCVDNTGFLGFLCGIIDTFRPLCALAGVPCIGPDFVQKHISKLKDKAVESVLDKFKEHFLFNITVIHDFDINGSATDVINVAEQIMKEIHASIEPFFEIIGLAQYFILFFCLYTFIRAAIYRRKYLLTDNHDNCYITKNFIVLNELRVKKGVPSLLPLNKKEQSLYISPQSLRMTAVEKNMLSFMRILPYMIFSIFIIVVDFGAYFLLGKAHQQLSANITVTAPLIFNVTVTGSNFFSDFFRQIISSFEDLVKGQVQIVTAKCLITPSKPDYKGYIIIGLLYGLAFLATMVGVYLTRLRRSLCAYYYPYRELERVCFLYNTIICERPERNPYHIKHIVTSNEDQQPSSFFYKLAKRNSLFYRLVRLMGKEEQFCLECAKIRTEKNSQEFLNCITMNCRGLYCGDCCIKLENACKICLTPLTYSDSTDEEIDSSDEEQVQLWLEERGSNKRFRKVQEKNAEEDEDSDTSSELSEDDYDYQEQSPSSDSSDEETLDETFAKLAKMKKNNISPKMFQRR